jgi:hypothetical protein
MVQVNIKLGQKLYKYSTLYLMKYEVFGILEREEGVYYQIRCLSCTHSCPCEVLVKFNDNGKLKYVSMLNDSEEDRQYYWHTDEGIDFYYFSKKEALENLYKRKIELCEKKIKELENQIENNKESILKYNEQLKGLLDD